MAILRLTGDVSGHCDIAAANVANSVSVTAPTQSGNLISTPYGSVASNGSLLIGNTATSSFITNTLTQGTGIIITNGQGSITIAATGLGATDQFARDRANGAFAQANIAVANHGGTINLSPAFAQLSSNVSQLPANTNNVAVFFDTQDVLTGITHAVGATRVFVSSNGLYQIIASGQVSRGAGALKQRADYWFRKNGTDIANSSVGITMEENGDISEVTNKYVLELVANDYIEVVQAVQNSTISLGLTRATSLASGPTRPAIMLTMVKILTAVTTPGFGTSTLNFGSAPGNNDATLTVTGQAQMPANAHIHVYIQGNDTTAEHSGFQHRFLTRYIGCSVSNVIASTGFTINLLSDLRLTGNVAVRWSWNLN